MPILEQEVSIYPPSLLNGFQAENISRTWWALRTKPRQEKAVARALNCRDIPFYLPLVAKMNLIRGKKVRAHIPLFTSYVFLFGSDEERVAALQTNRLVHILPDAATGTLVDSLRTIQQMIASGVPLTLESRLSEGQLVRIRCGTLRGIEGKVVERRNKVKLLVAVDLLQQGASIEIDDYMLEAI